LLALQIDPLHRGVGLHTAAVAHIGGDELQQFARLLHIGRVELQLAGLFERAHAGHDLLPLEAQPARDGGDDDAAVLVVGLERRAQIGQREQCAAHDHGGIDGEGSNFGNGHSEADYSTS
jgi:hypothetical protein